MRNQTKAILTIGIVAGMICPALAAAATISLEIVTGQGVQITAPQQWVQLLNGVGVTNVRIRGSRAGDKPTVETLDTRSGDAFRVVGVLNRRDELLLPGGKFGKRDRSRLRDYFSRLGADGADRLTAQQGRFGLTKEEFEIVYKDLGQPIAESTVGKSSRDLIGQARLRLTQRLVIDRQAAAKLNAASVLATDYQSLSYGTALAAVLHNQQLVLIPTKPRGESVAYQIVPKTSAMPSDSYWPVGWESDARPRTLAPNLFQFINVEIDGFTLSEAIGAIEPRLGVPLLWDQQALAERGVDPDSLQVKLAKTKTYYKRILDKLLFQARLKLEVRTDEAGQGFLWITR